jgi:3-oxoadipate enol-lactonase
MRGFQGGRPSIHDFADEISRLALPVLIVVGDEDEPCLEPSLFLKKTIAAAGLAVFPKTGHVVNLEEPALFNQTLDGFLTLVEAGRWPPRDPRSVRK